MRRGILGGSFSAKWFDSIRTDVAGIVAAILIGILLYVVLRMLTDRQ